MPPGGSELLAQLTAETGVATNYQANQLGSLREASGNLGSNG